jgi:hypothetical protein
MEKLQKGYRFLCEICGVLCISLSKLNRDAMQYKKPPTRFPPVD